MHDVPRRIDKSMSILAAFILSTQARVDVRIQDDEAQAVIRAARAFNNDPSTLDTQFQKVTETLGYQRLKEREISMGRPFDEQEFRALIQDIEPRKASELESTLIAWTRMGVSRSARQALFYLPSSAVIKAKVYPVIKPKTNSFVFDTQGDPSIFLYLDPKQSPDQFMNTVTHELHHIGLSSCKTPAAVAAQLDKLGAGPRSAVGWVSAFGEGLAMLAAAGGADIHPHAVSPKADRERWDHDVANFDTDLRAVEAFLLRVANGKLTHEEEQKAGMEFFGVQGPWYTVGWKMAVTIEKAKGHQALVGCMTDMRQLLKLYNECADGSPGRAKWSPLLLSKLGL